MTIHHHPGDAVTVTWRSLTLGQPAPSDPDFREHLRSWCRFYVSTDIYDQRLAVRYGVDEGALSAYQQLRVLSSGHAHRARERHVPPGSGAAGCREARDLASRWSLEEQSRFLDPPPRDVRPARELLADLHAHHLVLSDLGESNPGDPRLTKLRRMRDDVAHQLVDVQPVRRSLTSRLPGGRLCRSLSPAARRALWSSVSAVLWRRGELSRWLDAAESEFFSRQFESHRRPW